MLSSLAHPGAGRRLRGRAASRADMAAPAYPAWVTRWVSGQWRNKKRPPALRPPRALALADKVANRREEAAGELLAARGRPGPGAEPPPCPGGAVPLTAPCAPQGRTARAGAGHGVRACRFLTLQP